MRSWALAAGEISARHRWASADCSAAIDRRAVFAAHFPGSWTSPPRAHWYTLLWGDKAAHAKSRYVASGRCPHPQSYPAVVFSYLLLTEYLQLQSAANTQATHVLRPAPKRDDEAGAQEARVAIAFCLVESRWSPCTRALVGARHETTQRALWPAVTGQKEDRRDN